MVKLAAGTFLFATSAVFVAGCSQETGESTAPVEPQYSQRYFLVPADVCSGSTASPAADRSAARQNKAEAVSARPADINGIQIDSRADLSGITADTPFGQAIKIMRNSTSPPLNVVVLWNDLQDNPGIDAQTPIGVDIVSGVSLRRNLEIILASLSTRGKRIGYAVTDGVVVISTKYSLPSQMRSRTYNVTDLSSRPADYYSPSGQGGSGNEGR